MTNPQPIVVPQQGNSMFYMIAGVIIVLMLGGAYFIFTKKKEEGSGGLQGASDGSIPLIPVISANTSGCIAVDPTLPIWTDPGWLDEVGINYMKTLVNNRYGEFNLKSQDEATQTGIGFFKALGVRPTKAVVMKYKNELITYMKSDSKAFHWNETVGRLRCA